MSIFSKILDSIDISKQLNYQTNGLTVISNNTNVIPRDSAGNVMLHEDADNNPLLIIEPTTKKVTTKSILRVIDTQFNYFKFPATTTIIDEADDLDLDLNLNTDPIYARYKPSEDRRIAAGSFLSENFSGILMDEIEDGIPQKNTNAYYITKEIKNSGLDLRFRITLQHRYDTPDRFIDPQTGNFVSENFPGRFKLTETSEVMFSLIKTNVETGLNRTYKVYTEDTRAMSQYQVKTLSIDDVLLNSEFDIGDTFSIGAVCEHAEEFKFHTINAITSYWVITDNSKSVDEWNQPVTQINDATAEES